MQQDNIGINLQFELLQIRSDNKYRRK